MCVRPDRPAHRKVAPDDETREPPLDAAPLEQDVPTALPATQSNVRAEAVNQPLPAPARVGSPQIHEVSEAEFNDLRLLGGHYASPSWRHAAKSITAADSIRARPSRPGAADGRDESTTCGVAI